MSARIAHGLATLRSQVNAAWPDRRKSHDGWIGDAAHSARKSDHNPNARGVVCAIDITHDPQHGCDAGALVQAIAQSRDARVSYLIWNRRICASYAIGKAGPWVWRPYSGSNPHDKHCHVSVRQDRAMYDDPRKWRVRRIPEKEAIAGTAAASSGAATVAAFEAQPDAQNTLLLVGGALLVLALALAAAFLIRRWRARQAERAALSHPIGPADLGLDDAHVTKHGDDT